jgi:hypothetical protein
MCQSQRLARGGPLIFGRKMEQRYQTGFYPYLKYHL